jgi:glycosyltransferase involved in cell wall biosynthesis
MTRPAVSVVIPTHNRARMVVRAVESALPQCRPGDEVIVVDDASQDDTAARLQVFGDRIRYERVRHGGAGWARNCGIGLARNPLVAFLDSDDEWLPGKLELQRTLLAARPDVLFCFTDHLYRRPDGQEFHGVLRYLCGEEWFREDCAPVVPFSSIAALPAGQTDVPVYVGDLYAKQMEKEFVQVGTLVYRRELAAALRFPEDLRIRQDWEFVGRLARLGPAAYLDYESEVVHRHAGGQLTNLDDTLLVKARLKLLQRVWGQDEVFLQTHGERYRRVLDELRVQRVKDLIGDGSLVEAREELGRVQHPPMMLRVLGALPDPLPSALVHGRRRLRRLLRGGGRPRRVGPLTLALLVTLAGLPAGPAPTRASIFSDLGSVTSVRSSRSTALPGSGRPRAWSASRRWSVGAREVAGRLAPMPCWGTRV